MRLATVALASLIATSAFGQVAEDCNGDAFLLRPFPRRIVMNHAADIFKDPLNTKFGVIAGRCERAGEMTVVCGVAARMNRNGYIDRSARFYGLYKDGKFVYLGTGQNADVVCQKEIAEHMPL